MVSATKEQSSFAHFFKTKGGIPRDNSGRISEFEAGLNAEGLKGGGGRMTGCHLDHK